jgi:hypothetical protein
LKLVIPTELTVATLLCLCVAAVACDSCIAAETPPPVAIGIDMLAHPERLPFFYPPGTQTLQFSSYDLAGGNADGNFSSAFVKYVDTNGEYVIFDAYGPGSLNRQQLNIWQFGVPGAGESRIRYYFDDEQKARIDLSADEFSGAARPPFDKPFAFAGHFDDPEFNWHCCKGPAFAIQYYPLAFAKRLKITLTPSSAFRRHLDSLKNKVEGTSWYQFTYLLYPPGTPVASWEKDGTSSKAVRTAWSRLGDDPKPKDHNETAHSSITIPPGKTAVLLKSDGQGSIASLKLHMAPCSEETFFNVRIRMSWDGMRGAVDMPIGVFFGGGAKDYTASSEVVSKKLANLFYGFEGPRGDFYSYWPMPYWHSAKIELINETAQTVRIDADIQQTPKERLDYPRDQAGYFYAKETKSIDQGDGLFAPAFRESGYGHVVGIGFYSQDYSMDGDEFTYFDGSRTPQIHGDGTEDDHNQGWGGGAYQQPLWGGVINGFQGAYRIYLSDPYVFDDQVKINYELSQLGARADSKTDVVIYYYRAAFGSPRLVQTDSVDVGRPESEKAHDYTIAGQTWEGALRSAYDGYEKEVEANTFMEDGRAFNGHSAFTVAIDPGNVGVRLRRLLSRIGNGVQTAEVRVDGVTVARPWHVVFNSSAPENQAWVDSDFEIPESMTHGKSKLLIEIRYLSSTKRELNEFHYWIFSHLPANYSR